MANFNQGDGTEIVAALNEENVEAAAALAYIAEVFESDPEAAFAKTLGHWSQWLGDEGYTADSVEQVIRQVVSAELETTQQLALVNSLSAEMSIREAVNLINSQTPGLITAFMRHVDHGADLHATVLGVSGGTSRRSSQDTNLTTPQSKRPRLGNVQKHLSQELGERWLENSEKRDGYSPVDSVGKNSERLTLPKDVGDIKGDSARVMQTARNEFANVSFRSDPGPERNEAGRNGRGTQDPKISRALQGIQEVLRESQMDGRNRGGVETPLSRAVDDLRAALEAPQDPGPERNEPNSRGEQKDNLSRALQGVSDLKERLSTEDPVQRQTEMVKARFIENTIAEVRKERQQRKAIIENIETAIKTDPRAVAELVMKNRDEIPFEIATLREGRFIRKENKEPIQRIDDEISTERNKIWMEERRERREQEVRALEDAIRNHPEEAAKALIVERVENPIPDTRDQQLLDREEDRLAEREVDRFIDDIRSIRQQKREQEEMILKDIETKIKTDPKGVAELVMKNREDIPFEIDTLQEGIFIRKENKERMQLIDDVISTERNKIWMAERRERREQEVRALEDAIRNHPEEAAKALIVERVENPTPDTRDQQILDREEDRLAEREVDRFIDDIRSIRQQKREQEEMILKDIETAIKNDPRGVAELVMKNRDEIPFEIATLREGRFIRKENEERIQRIDDEISTERNKIWVEERRERREQEVRALEEAIRIHPEEAAKALIVERVENPTPDTRDQQILDRKEDRVAEREVDRFIARAVEDLRRAQENSSAGRLLERVAYGLDEKISEVISKRQGNDDAFPKDANIELRLREKIANKINEQNVNVGSAILGNTKEVNTQTARPLSEQVRDPFDPFTREERLLFKVMEDPAGFERKVENIVDDLISLEIKYYTMKDSRAEYDNREDQGNKKTAFNNYETETKAKQEARVQRQIDELMKLSDDAKRALTVDIDSFYFDASGWGHGWLKYNIEHQARIADSFVKQAKDKIEEGVDTYIDSRPIEKKR